ncbi:MAG: DUF4493 domain-containing protein [Rikenellaceae bacterium]
MFNFFKFRVTTLIALFGIITLTGCVKDEYANEPTGEFSLALSADDTAIEAQTKAAAAVDVAQFKVNITTLGGDLLKSWDKYSDVPEYVRFGKGNYMISSFGGDSTLVGFDAPSYSGASKLSVYSGNRQTVSLVCKLNKMAVSVVVSAGMQAYYSDYSTEVSISPKSALTYIKGEARCGYFPVAPLAAKISLTRKDGSKFEATMPPITLTKAAEHYTINFDVNGGVGSIGVTVTEKLTNDVVLEAVIPAEATASMPPYFVASSGFTILSPTVPIIESATADVRMIIKARGYIKNCIIGVKSAYLISKGVPREFNLASTAYNAELAAILKSVGMVWSDNMPSSTMAEIDFSGMLDKLPADIDKNYDHILTIKVEDMYQRQSEVLPLCFSVSQPIIEIDKVSRVAENGPTVDVDLDCVIANGSFDHLSKIEMLNGFTWQQVDKTKYTKHVDPLDKQKATIKITGLDIASSQYTFRLFHKNPAINIERRSDQITAYRVTPKIIMSVLNGTDVNGVTRVASQHVAQLEVKLETTDPTFVFDASKMQLKVRNQGSWENIGRVVSSNPTAKTAIMEVTGLTPSEKYRIRCVYDGRYNSFNEGIFQTDGFHFENWGATQTLSNVQWGGRIGWKKTTYYAWGAGKHFDGYDDYELTTLTADNINDSYWTTNGTKTFSGGFSPYNSWYIAPSILKTGGASGSGVELRSVAWDNRGPAVPDGNIGLLVYPPEPDWAWSADNYNRNTRDQVAPPDFSTAFKSSGKLFLGTYTCNHDPNGNNPNETYNERGLKIKTRPIGVNFSYKFSSYNGDKACVRAVVYDVNDNIVGSGELEISSDTPSWSQSSVSVVYTNQAKADHINIIFSSSIADKLPSSPNANMQGAIKLNTTDRNARIATGNLFSIDDVELKY